MQGKSQELTNTRGLLKAEESPGSGFFPQPPEGMHMPVLVQ